MEHPGLPGQWLELDATLPAGPAATSWAPSLPQPGLDCFLVAKEEARWKKGRKVLRNTRSIQISFSSAFPMLTLPALQPQKAPLSQSVLLWAAG